MNVNRVCCFLRVCQRQLIIPNQISDNSVRGITTAFRKVYVKDRSFERRDAYVTQVASSVETKRGGDFSLIQKVLSKLPFAKNVAKARLNASAYLLYESIVDKIRYGEFFEEFNLPDTFYSWFAITELHVWMLMVRCMAEGDDGRAVRNAIVEALWADVGVRVKKLGAVNPAETRRQVAELSEQFQAALIAYDEGLQMNDLVLAGAVWRRMYQEGSVDPENLDQLVKYVRKHINVLDGISKEELLSQKAISWEPLTEK